MADSGDNFFKGFVLGSILGGVLGVLFAPKSGREMREDLSEETEKLMEQFKVDVEHAKKAALKSFEENKDRIISKLAADDSPAVESVTEEPEAGPEEKPEAERPRRRRPPRSRPTKETTKKS